jgi:REP element-mobilizing transposase RayT
MARLARGEYLDPQTIQIVHVTSRCVRRAFLCGCDPYSGTNYEHRRQWIRERLEFLASIFAVDCLTFAVMSNHFHLILRSRPEVVREWSDDQVARRWLRLCPVRKRSDGQPAEPDDNEVAMILNDPRRIAELRVRLSDISWWMRMTSEKIAKQANREDKCTGRFWEGRYKAQLLLDEASILACAMYVDLNPVRAAIAESLEESDFTGAKARIDDLKESNVPLKRASEPTTKNPDRISRHKSKRTKRWERSRGRKQSGWLSPIEINELCDSIGSDPSPCGRRASLKGFLSMSILRYLELLDWTGRQLRSDKRGSIPPGIAPILSRLGIEADDWLDLASQFGALFRRAAGTSISLSAEAARRGQSWMHGRGASHLG